MNRFVEHHRRGVRLLVGVDVFQLRHEFHELFHQHLGHPADLRVQNQSPVLANSGRLMIRTKLAGEESFA